MCTLGKFERRHFFTAWPFLPATDVALQALVVGPDEAVLRPFFVGGARSPLALPGAFRKSAVRSPVGDDVECR
eukprot:11226215-Lingulodinium_polyedra.AAC.1